MHSTTFLLATNEAVALDRLLLYWLSAFIRFFSMAFFSTEEDGQMVVDVEALLHSLYRLLSTSSLRLILRFTLRQLEHINRPLTLFHPPSVSMQEDSCDF